MARKVIIDADPGIGDALAIALALFDPEVDVVGLTATAGCVSGPAATRNAQAIVELLDPPKLPRLGESTDQVRQLDRDFGSHEVSTAALNGPTGLGDLQYTVSDLHNRRESAKLMVDLVRSEPHEITLLTMGPLTNIEFAAERAPDFLGLLKQIVCLGGSVTAGGDVTAAAEFNVFADPEAARHVLLSPVTKTLVPLDVSSRVVLTFDQFNRLPARETSALGRFYSQLLPFAFRAHHEHLGLEGVRLNEIVALCAVARSRLFKSATMAIDIETTGELTRGMSVFDRRGVGRWQKNIEVLTEVDAQGVFDYVCEIAAATGRT